MDGCSPAWLPFLQMWAPIGCMGVVLAASKCKEHGELSPVLRMTAAGDPVGKLSLAIQAEQLKPRLHVERTSDRV